ncbi:MAG: hypothetical protein HQK55_05310 [Deltaproteobacteria bacterium]|nr:hypothetical protein [Deltaproteobacteria bacterium]
MPIHCRGNFFLFFMFFVLGILSINTISFAQSPMTLVGQWGFSNQNIEVFAEFFPDGTFQHAMISGENEELNVGNYQFDGQVLTLITEGSFVPLRLPCRLTSADTLTVQDPALGQMVMRRLGADEPGNTANMPTQPMANAPSPPAVVDPAQPSMVDPNQSAMTVPGQSKMTAPGQSMTTPPAATTTAPAKATAQPSTAPPAATTTPPATASTAPATAPATPSLQTEPTGKRPTVFMRRVWEQNEKAFTYLLPQGWKTVGGIFNVDPLKVNGPGNTISPKLDLTVKSDEQGTILFRWAPGWNYADLSLSPSGWSLFRPGQYYQGMLCRVTPTSMEFLTGFFKEAHPGASDVRVVTQDSMPEVVKAYEEKSAEVNAKIRQLGLKPIQFSALAVVVEYTEKSVKFREVLFTTIADNRSAAFMWSNGDTLQFRAPLDQFDQWKPVFDTIRLSRQMNPEWLRAVAIHSGQRAEEAWNTQQYINKVSNEIVEHRRRTNAEINHQNYLLISGQDEYRNPFTGQIEQDTSQWRYRWVNNEGDVLYTDENSYDPNRHEEYNTREWKRTEAK